VTQERCDVGEEGVGEGKGCWGRKKGLGLGTLVTPRTRILYHRSKPSIKQLRPHAYTNLFNVYVTQVKSRIGSFNTTTLYLPIVRASLPSHISLLDEWQSSSKRIQFSALQPRAPRVQRNRLRDRRSKTGTSLYRISSMKSRARTMHCKETAQTRIKGSSVMR